MKHPICPPEYTVEDTDYTAQHLSYTASGVRVKYIRIKHNDASDRAAANIDQKGTVWEIWRGGGFHATEFPSLDAALQYVETKMALGILGDKE